MTFTTSGRWTRPFAACLIAVFFISIQPFFFTADAAVQQQEESKKKKKKKKKEEPKEEEEKGKLDSFEDEATEEVRTSSYEGTSEESDEESSGAWAFVGYVLYKTFYYGGAASWWRVRGRTGGAEYDRYVGPREAGEPVIPYADLALNYQNVESDVEAVDGAVEVGYGPVAFRYRHTRYTEKDPDTELDFSQGHFLYRMTFSKFVEWDIGMGAATLKGNEKNSGFSFTLPFRFYVWRHLGFSFRPTWSAVNSRSINDYDLGLSFGIRYVSVKAGYRWTKVGSASLDGPFAGLSFYY